MTYFSLFFGRLSHNCLNFAGLFLLLVLASTTSAHSDENNSVDVDIFPAINMRQNSRVTEVVALLNVFNLVRSGSNAKFFNGENFDKINFFFASGENFIVDQRVSVSALTLFQDQVVSEITKLRTNSEQCYIQPIEFDNGKTTLVIVHNENNEFSEDVFLCLSAGLWRFGRGGLDGFDAIDWRASYLGSLAKGN
ncbi:MAG: hypothetical protein ACU0BN_13780 [Sulfitobacter sp.]